jgi:hypothetical protein
VDTPLDWWQNKNKSASQLNQPQVTQPLPRTISKPATTTSRYISLLKYGALQQIVAPATLVVSNTFTDGQMALNWPTGGMLLEAPSITESWTTNTTGANSCNISPAGSSTPRASDAHRRLALLDGAQAGCIRDRKKKLVRFSVWRPCICK